MKTNRTKVCPYCGETISYNAKACPGCGSDENTGWSDQTYLDGIDIGDDVDYEENVRKEFSKHGYRPPLLKMIIAGILLALFMVMLVKGMFQ